VGVVKRLALLHVETSDDDRLCSVDCHLLDVTTGGEWSCLGFTDERGEALALDGYQATAVRCAPCLSATAQADRLVAVRDAAIGWSEGRVDDRGGEIELLKAVRGLESTRAATEGK
jgi:hypothetical protein